MGLGAGEMRRLCWCLPSCPPPPTTWNWSASAEAIVGMRCHLPPQASPHFPRDIKESSGGRAILERILGLAQLVDPCEVVGAIPRSRLTSESASRHRFGSYYGHPGALLVQGNSRRS